MSSAPRKQAPRPAKPVGRYWKGKAPKGAEEQLSSDEEDEEMQLPEEEGDVQVGGEQEFLGMGGDEEDEDAEAAPKAKVGKMSVALRDVNISKEGRVTVAGKEEVGRTELEEEEETSEEESEAEAKPKVPGQAGEEESEEESSEYETDSEEEKPKLQFRPVFVPKRGRVTVAEREAMAEDTEEALKKKEAEAEERRKQSHDMVADSIRRELAEKEKEDEAPEIDDTDGLDPAAEFEAWRLRELARIKRDKEAEVAREQEREEIERRRALPEEQRLKEDLEHAKKLRDEKPKGQQKFLQKYWHKGAFHQDEEILKRHDFTEATESTIDVSVLPQVMQVKNFGKRGRTKYTHLLDQDTTVASGGFGGTGSIKSVGKGTDGGGCFLCGGPHLKKDCPQNTGTPLGRPGTGANAAPTGPRNDSKGSWRDRDDGYAPRDRERGGDRSREHDRRDDRYGRDRGYDDRRGGGRDRDDDGRDSRRTDRYDGRERERERSPRRDRWRDDDDRRWRERRRSRSRSAGHERDEKRRRKTHQQEQEVFAMSPPSGSRSRPNPKRVVKVAVIGSGLAGLTTAYLLSQLKSRPGVHFDNEDVEFEVHLFEKATALGMDSHSVSITPPGYSGEWRVDVPMRSFQGGYYTQLIALYKHLGVSFREADFSYSFSYLPSTPTLTPSTPHEKSSPPPTLRLFPSMIYGGASGRAGVHIPTALRHTSFSLHPTRLLAHLLFLAAFALSTLVLLYNYLRLLLFSTPLLRPRNIAELSWEEWAARMTPRGVLSRWLALDRRWEQFAENVCIPLFSAVCTAAREDVLAHPAEEFLDFIYLTFLTHHYVVSHGVRDVVARLTASLPSSQIHLGAPTTALLPSPASPGHAAVVCTPAPGAEPVAYDGFAHVVFATQANHAAPLVERYARALGAQAEAKAAAALGRCLARFEYRRTVVVNHTDPAFLPVEPADQQDLNLVTITGSQTSESEKKTVSEKTDAKALTLTVPASYTMTTHRLPRPPTVARAAPAVFQTTNPVVAPRAGSVLSVARLERALLTREGKEAVGMLVANEGEAGWRGVVRRWVGLGGGEDGAGVGVLQGKARREMGKDAVGLWVVGSYAQRGIPLLEGCVAGAREVVECGILKSEGGRVSGAPW
ncbi:hypothetical protein DENSPDRAFT_863571 [Dentipellis sp. KUC8613]|nr:hypothetical protein DENSPDRAFT_863571 [Dentipellis sp. KUC8613]